MLCDSSPPPGLWEHLQRKRIPHLPRFRGQAQSLKVMSSPLAWALRSGWQGSDQALAGMSGDLYSGSNSATDLLVSGQVSFLIQALVSNP